METSEQPGRRDRPSGKWIWTDAGYRNDVQVGRFRRSFRWGGDTRKASICLSADTRFRAWWNGCRLGRGPAAGDVAHWSYERFEIELQPGENCLAVEVLFQGRFESLKYPALRPAVIAWTEEAKLQSLIATGTAWRCRLSGAHAAQPQTSQAILPGYTGLGAFEAVDGTLLPVGWELPGFDDSCWGTAYELPVEAHFSDSCGPQELSWSLLPSTLPSLTEAPQAWHQVVERGTIGEARDEPWSDGARKRLGLEGQPEEPGDIHCFPADGESHYLILDAGEMTTAFVSLELESSKEAELTLRYAEALSEDLKKGSRTAESGGDVEGFFDRYRLRAGRQAYEPFFWRPFRFLKLTVSGNDAPVRLRALNLRRCVYPGEVRAEFESSLPELDTIKEVSWRTAQLCAHDTHDDCPYYEQLPYAGDLRLHGPIGAMMTGDYRLLERSIRMYAWSQRSDGMILTRYPARTPQIIPPFALIWIQLVEEFYQMTGRADLVHDLFPTVRGILEWMQRYRCPERILKRRFPYWNFTDWSIPGGDGTEHNAGNRASLMMFYAGALQAAEGLAGITGHAELASLYAASCASLKAQCREKIWDDEQHLFRDDIDEPARALHQTILGVLYGVVPDGHETVALDAVLGATDRYAPTVPFNFYLFRAASRLDAYERVWQRIGSWRAMLASGTTTWFEMPEPTRSDCHAWSSWILRDYFTEILGIHPLAPGYRKVLVRPRLIDGMEYARGALPTVAGRIEVSWRISKTEGLEVEVTLPAGCEGGVLVIGGKASEIPPGTSFFRRT